MARTRKPMVASSRLIPRVLSLFRKRGVGVDVLARELGLPRDAEHLAEVEVAPDLFERLMAAGVREFGDPLLAVHLPDLLEWPTYSVGELAAHASPTLRDAFERVVRYGSLFYAHLSFACEDRGGEFVVIQRLRSGRYSNEYALASTLCHARRLSGATLAPRRVFFAHEEVPQVEALRRHFGTNDIAFGYAENGLAFSLSDVARPSIGYDARLLATADALAARVLEERPPACDFVAAVAAKLRSSLARRSDAGAIARKMGLSMRTLQRRLEEHDITFTDLLERVRKDVALEAVRDPSLTLTEAARRAGFSDAATFGRAFKRWTGRAPGEYRRSAARY